MNMAKKKIAFTILLNIAIIGLLYSVYIIKTREPIDFFYLNSLCANFVLDSSNAFKGSFKYTFNSGQIISTYINNSFNLSTNSTVNYNNDISVPKKIFLMETSGKNYLNARQACAVESAARHNSEMQVVVFLVSPTLDLSNREILSLAEIPNISFQYLNLDKYFNQTPLNTWFWKGNWKKSRYKISHMSDALRFLTLWKFGGIYLDLDVVVIKSLSGLKNCAGMESETIVAPGVMAFDRKHKFLSKCITEFSSTYRGYSWGWNGPDLITRVLKQYCGHITKLDFVADEKCDGITVLPENAFYALQWYEWYDFFDVSKTKDVMRKLNDSYLIHMWNRHSNKTPVKIGLCQAYEVLAKRNCPSVYVLQKDVF